MPAFPRTVLPSGASFPTQPTGLASVARSGRVQRRTTSQVGRTWTEVYAPFVSTNATARAWLAQVTDYFRAGTAFTVYHVAQKALLGSGGGTPLVNGAGQSGSSLITDGWTASTAVLKAGDVITVAGVLQLLEVAADVTSDGSGNATLAIDPPIAVASSPADNAALTINSPAGSVLYVAFLESVEWPSAGADGYYSGLRLTFRELPGVSSAAAATFSILDNFNRANNPLSSSLTSSSGALWTIHSGTPTIASNQLTNGGGDCIMSLPVSSANGTTRYTVKAIAATGQGGPMGRVTDASNFFRWVYSKGTPDTYFLVKNASGFSVLGSFVQSPVVNDVLDLDQRGNTHKGIVNGVTLVTATDSFSNSVAAVGAELKVVGDITDDLQWMP
jgi:hypothetical protein